MARFARDAEIRVDVLALVYFFGRLCGLRGLDAGRVHGFKKVIIEIWLLGLWKLFVKFAGAATLFAQLCLTLLTLLFGFLEGIEDRVGVLFVRGGIAG